MTNEVARYAGTTNLVPMSELREMAKVIVTSKLFGVKDETAAIALMLLAQAENLHPATIAQDYDIISGRAARKTHSVLSRFQQAGGKVQWEELTDKCARAIFTPPASAGGPLKMEWTIEQAAKIQAVEWVNDQKKTIPMTEKYNWKNYPRAMLRARCIAEGIRAVFPAALGGMMVVEEAQDTDVAGDDAPMEVQQPRAKSDRPVIEGEARVIKDDPAKQAAAAEQTKPAAAATTDKKDSKVPTLADCVKLIDDNAERVDEVIGTVLEWRKHLSAEDQKKLGQVIDSLGTTPDEKKEAVVVINDGAKRILIAKAKRAEKTIEALEEHMGCKLDAIPLSEFNKANAFVSVE